MRSLLPAADPDGSSGCSYAVRAHDATCGEHDGGHIAILAILSFVFIFTEMLVRIAGIGLAVFSVPLATAISGLEIIVVLVQAYVFTLLSAVFIGMAIHSHH